MPLINRATLPQEFFDITSALLLKQPEPQYLHATLWKMALSASFETDAQLGLMVPGREFGSAGADYGSAEDDRLSLSDGLYDTSLTVIPELGQAPGHTVRLNRPVYANTTYTEASREVPSGTTISTTPQSVTSEQANLTLKRYAGPFDQAHGQVRPYGVGRFDSSVMLHRSAGVAGRHLRRDFDRTLDQFVRTLFDQAATIIRPAGMTNDDTSAAAGSFPFSHSMLVETEANMDDANIPTFPNGKRVMVLSPRQCQQIAQDAQFNRQSVFAPDFNPIFAGTYFRSIGQWDLFKSTTLARPANANTIPIHYAQAWGPGAVGSGIGELPRTAYNTQDNYGEDALVVWLLYAAFGVLDSRFIRRITTD